MIRINTYNFMLNRIGLKIEDKYYSSIFKELTYGFKIFINFENIEDGSYLIIVDSIIGFEHAMVFIKQNSIILRS